MIGVEQDDFALHFVTAVSQGWRDHGSLLESYFDFVSPDQDPLAPGSLIPQFQLGSTRFGIVLPDRRCRGVGYVGVARPVLMHRVYVCPDCRAILVIRRRLPQLRWRSSGQIAVDSSFLLRSCRIRRRVSGRHRKLSVRSVVCGDSWWVPILKTWTVRAPAWTARSRVRNWNTSATACTAACDFRCWKPWNKK